MSDDLPDPAWCTAMEELGNAVLAGADPEEVARLVQVESAARKEVSDAQS
jgi:hypothetical protein